MSIFFQLKNQELTDTEQKIAEYILEYPEAVLKMPIRQLAKKTYVSPTSVYKLCQKLGYEGYKEFILSLSSDLHHAVPEINGLDVNFPFDSDDSDRMIAKKIASLSFEIIENTEKLLNETQLSRAIDYLSHAESIFGVGVSLSYNRIMEFHTKMLRINKFVKIIPLQSDQFHLANNATEKDVAIVVSYSGETSEVVIDTQVFHEKGCKILAITSNSTSSIACYADVVLPLPETEDGENNISPYTSQIATEYILNVLYSCVYKRNYVDNMKKKSVAPMSKLFYNKD